MLKICGERIKVHGDIITVAGFFFVEDDKVPYGDRKPNDTEKQLLVNWCDCMLFEEWEAETKQFAIDNRVDLRELMALIRFAISGQTHGPGLWESLDELGYHSVSRRVTNFCWAWWNDDVIAWIKAERVARGLANPEKTGKWKRKFRR